MRGLLTIEGARDLRIWAPATGARSAHSLMEFFNASQDDSGNRVA